MFTPVRGRRRFEEALDQIAERVKTGELHVGDRLPSERDMAAQMGISRPTLREALKLLAGADIIEVRPRSGGMILKSDLIPPDLLRERFELVMEEVEGVLEARRVVEAQIAQIAGQTADESDFEELRTTIALQREHAGDHDRLLQLDERFHLGLARATDNAMLMDLVRTVQRRMAIARDMTPREPQDWDRELSIHQRTLEALETRESAAIDEAMDEHLSYLETIWEETTGRRLPRSPASGVGARGPRPGAMLAVDIG